MRTEDFAMLVAMYSLGMAMLGFWAGIVAMRAREKMGQVAGLVTGWSDAE